MHVRNRDRWILRRRFVRFEAVDFPEEDLVAFGAVILRFRRSREDQVAVELQAIDVVVVDFCGVKLGVVDCARLVVVLQLFLCFVQFSWRGDRP